MTRLFAQLFRLGYEGYCLIVQRNGACGAPNCLAQPAHAEQQQ